MMMMSPLYVKHVCVPCARLTDGVVKIQVTINPTHSDLDFSTGGAIQVWHVASEICVTSFVTVTRSPISRLSEQGFTRDAVSWLRTCVRIGVITA